MAFSNLLIEDAAQDLEEPYLYIGRQDGRQKAEYVLDRIEKAIERPSSRGHTKSTHYFQYGERPMLALKCSFLI